MQLSATIDAAILLAYHLGENMNKNPAIALMQIETALNHINNTMVNEEGVVALDEKFVEILDELITKLSDTCDIAKALVSKKS